MTKIIGPGDIRDTGIPSGIDGNLVLQFQLKEGQTYQGFLNELALALGAKNQELSDMFGFMCSMQEAPQVHYPDGSAVNASKRVTDIDEFEIVGGTDSGHMLPLHLHGKAVGKSWKYFKRTNEHQIAADIATVVDDHSSRFEIDVFTRLLTNTETAVGTGYDVPFVNGGAGNIDYTPRTWGGHEHDSTHDHFLVFDTDGSPAKGFDDALEESAEHLVHHGHKPVFDAMVSFDDLDSYRALDNFIEMVDPIVMAIDQGGRTGSPRFYAKGEDRYGVAGYYQSKFGLIRINYHERIPTGRGSMFKSYGILHPQNPLAIRYAEEGFGMYVLPVPSGQDDFPIQMIRVPFEFGIGVGKDRTNGVSFQVSTSDTWSNPSIS